MKSPCSLVHVVPSHTQVNAIAHGAHIMAATAAVHGISVVDQARTHAQTDTDDVPNAQHWQRDSAMAMHGKKALVHDAQPHKLK